MLNPNFRVVVNYPKVGLRVRNCQTTVHPTKAELGPVTNYNEWQMYLRFYVDAQYCANHAADTIIATESLLEEAYVIINQSAV